MATRLLLIRHATAEPGRDLPECDWPLSPEGRRQAETLAADLALRSIDAVWSSPYPRAVDTVKPFADRAGLRIEIDHDLRERLFSPVWIDDFEVPLKQSFDDVHFAVPGGESGHQCRERFMAALTRIATRHQDETVAVATHGNAIALVLSSLDASVDFEFWKAIRNPDLFELGWNNGFEWQRG